MMRNEPRFERLLRSKKPGRCSLAAERVQARKGNRARGLPFANVRVNHGVSKADDQSLFPVPCFSLLFVGRVPPIVPLQSDWLPSLDYSQGRGWGSSPMFGNVRVR